MPLVLNALAAAGGVATHILYFNKAEHHLWGLRYLSIALVTLFTGVLSSARYSDTSVRDAFLDVGALEGSFFAGVFASLLIYRIFLNPLNKFPGAFAARITSLWYSSSIKDANAYKLLLDLHNKHGDFVRVGSSELSIIHPDGVNTIYGLGSKCIKGSWYDNDAPLTSMHTSRNRALHDRRRRVWSPAFSDKALRGYEARIKGYGDDLIRQIGKEVGKPVDVTKWFNLYSFDVMGDLAFNKSFDMLESGEEHWAIKLLNEGMEPLSMNLPPWLFRVIVAIPGLSAGYWKFIKYCADRLDERWDAKVDTPDIMSALIQPFNQKPVGEELNMLQGDARLVIVAGSDTTATTLTHVFYQLAKNPQHIEILRKEIAPQMEDNGDVQHVKIQDLEHLNGVINEALRLNPPVPSAVWRKTPPEGIQLGETHIPGDMLVFCPQYVVGRNEQIYPQATKFHPERWYKDTHMIKKKSAFAPFSAGVYGCIGKPLALLELRTVIAKLLMTYDVKFAQGEDGSRLMNSRDHFTLGLGQCDMVFTQRKV